MTAAPRTVETMGSRGEGAAESAALCHTLRHMREAVAFAYLRTCNGHAVSACDVRRFVRMNLKKTEENQ